MMIALDFKGGEFERFRMNWIKYSGDTPPLALALTVGGAKVTAKLLQKVKAVLEGPNLYEPTCLRFSPKGEKAAYFKIL